MFDITEAVAKLLKRSCVESYYGTITSNLVTGGYVWVSRANGVVSLKIENIQQKRAKKQTHQCIETGSKIGIVQSMVTE